MAKKLEAAGYKVEREPGTSDVEDSLTVKDRRLNVSVLLYADEEKAKKALRGFKAVAEDNPEQIAVLQDYTRPELILSATVEEPAKLPAARVAKIAKLAIDVDPVELAKLETGTLNEPKRR
ncbi:MAG: hypothetical protein LC808_13600, partial [Actinobacteria bacterium]|nr:hypothetical protein [Actinomycetota bacterium]